MALVPVSSIKSPKLVVSPPKWLKIIAGVLLLMGLAACLLLPSETPLFRTGALIFYGLGLLLVIKKARDSNYLITLQANRDGIYFPSAELKHYFYVPWRYIGSIEKETSPLGGRALKLEILGEYQKPMRNNDHIGNTLSENDRTFIYIKPRLNNREKLLQRLDYFRRPVF